MEGGAHNLTKRAVRSTLLFLAAVAAAPASAHDFTDKNVKDLENAVEVWIGPDQVYIDYWFLFGEMEALGFRQGMDADGDKKISAAERKAWLGERKKRIDDVGFLVDLDEKPATPRLLSEPVLDTTVDVVGAVPFTLSFELSIPIRDLPPGDHTLRFAALNIQERPARQKLVVTVDQCEVVGGIPEDAVRYGPGEKPYADAPDTVSKVFLTTRDLKGAQLGPQIYVRFRKPAEYDTPTDPRTGRGGKVEKDKGLEGSLRALTSERLTFGVVIGALVLAFFWGMGHGLAPGHGKTIAAAYLVGERGTAGHAVILGVVVTITHLLSVVLMCIILNWAIGKARGTEYRDKVNYWSGVASGVITFLVGAGLFASRLRGARAARVAHDPHDHDHDHDHGRERGEHAPIGEHEHGHDHGDHDHGHSHVPAGGGTPSLWSIVSLGISGGVVPCPTAWVLLLLSIQVDRFEWGLFLILSFSLGLALTLVGIGLMLVWGKRALDRLGRGAGLFRVLGVASPIAIMALGAFLTWKVVAWGAAAG